LAAPPGWFTQLAKAMAGLQPGDFSRFPPPPESARPSAVLMLFAEGEQGPDLLLTLRASQMRAHSGQPAFPGGALQDDGEDAPGCALRESEEEVGVHPDSVTIAAELPPLWVPVTGFMVTPVLGWWHTPGPVRPQESEVAEVHRVPVSALADPANRVRVRHPSGYIGPGFDVAGMLVWGFTGGLVDALITMGGWQRPWLPGRLIEVGS
jgi:8-oxo-dGTP pyrophosphatase MutT (NUDIX family)